MERDFSTIVCSSFSGAPWFWFSRVRPFRVLMVQCFVLTRRHDRILRPDPPLLPAFPVPPPIFDTGPSPTAPCSVSAPSPLHIFPPPHSATPVPPKKPLSRSLFDNSTRFLVKRYPLYDWSRRQHIDSLEGLVCVTVTGYRHLPTSPHAMLAMIEPPLLQWWVPLHADILHLVCSCECVRKVLQFYATGIGIELSSDVERLELVL